MGGLGDRDQVRPGGPAGGRVIAGRVADGLAVMGLIPQPALAALFAVPGVQVIRGDNLGSARREAVLGVLPPGHLLPVRPGLPVELLDQDQPQRLHRGQLPRHGRGGRGIGLLQQVIAVPGVLRRQFRAGRLALRQPQIGDPLPVDPLPGRVRDRRQPARRGGGQRLQRRPHRLPGQLQPVQLPDPGQHVRGIGPLPHPGFYQAGLLQPGQQQIQQQLLPPAGHQPGPELAQHGKIEPRIGQLQAQAVLPVDPAPHRISRLPVRQVLSELQRRDHRQLRR